MSYYDTLLKYKDLDPAKAFLKVTPQDVERAITSEYPGTNGLLALLSPAAEKYLEPMAQKAHALTLQHFGRTIQLYTPMYLSNFCENQCAYCGFNAKNQLERRKLTLEEVEKEAAFIASTGIEHVLILTGDSRAESPVSYILECLQILKKHFASISAEIYALTREEYGALVQGGIDGLTIYQETYDEKVYKKVHSSGPKQDYRFRLDAPERAAAAGMRNVNIGTLLGLDDWRKEVFLMALHAQYLQDRYGDVEIGVSLPRLRPHAGDFKDIRATTDRNITQIITALRIFLPRIGITLSTRESAALRENLLPLGITRMSAGSTTRVGGHTIATEGSGEVPQFEISDERNVDQIKAMLAAKGYQPVLKDWMQL